MSRPTTAARPEPRRGRPHPAGTQRPAAALIMLGLVGLGAAATVLTAARERADVRNVDRRAADVVAARLGGALREALGAVRGADVLALDGDVSGTEFATFAADVIDGSLYPALAYAVVVPGGDRAAFEAATGLAIRDTDGVGGFRPAPVRARSIVVTEVHPLTDTTRSVLGFDLVGDDARRRAVETTERTGRPVISDRTSSVAGGRVSVSVVHAVRDPQGTVLGVVTSGLTIDDALDRSGTGRLGLAAVGLTMDGQELVAGSGGESQTFEVGGRTFAVTVRSGRGVGLLLPALTGGGTLVLAAVVGLWLRRDRLQRRGLEEAAHRSRGVAALAQDLAACTAPDRVLAQVRAHAGAVLGAATTLALQPPGEPALRLWHDADASGWEGPPPAAREAVLADTVERAAPVVQRDPAAPTAVSVPVTFSDDRCVGALAFWWGTPAADGEIDERVLVATTVAELAGRALERAVITDAIESRSTRLAALSHALASAHAGDEVVAAAGRHVAGVVGAQRARLVLGPADGDDASDAPAVDARPPSVARQVVGASGRRLGRLDVWWPLGVEPTIPDQTVLSTVGDLLGQTLARTARSEQEHGLITELQRDLLPEPAVVEGLEIAVRYEPALSLLGLGGDFYDVVVSDRGRLYLAIGDVSGHGSEAVAAMSELKGVMNHLLRSDVPLPAVLDQSDLILARRHIFATALVVEVDVGNRLLRYVNAGHPPAVSRPTDGAARLLDGGRRPLLGLPSADRRPPAVATAPVRPGDLLVLYTDGLVERRGVTVDASIEDMRGHIDRAADGPTGRVVDELIEAARRTPAAARVDDDIAVIALRVARGG